MFLFWGSLHLHQSGTGLDIAVFENWPPTTAVTSIRPPGWSIQLSEYKKHGKIDGTPLIPFNNKLYFDAQTGSGLYDHALWGTDGTVAGTNMVTDTITDQAQFQVFNNHLYFQASGDSYSPTKRELFRMNAAENVELFGDLLPYANWGSAGGTPGLVTGSWPAFPCVIGNNMYFVALQQDFYCLNSKATADIEPWVTDGSSVQMLADINQQVTSGGGQLTGSMTWATSNSAPFRFVDIGGGRAAFLADDIGGQFTSGCNTVPSNYQLFITDGTTAGTQRVTSLGYPTPGLGCDATASVHYFNGDVYFIADEGTGLNQQLYKYNVASGTTTRLSAFSTPASPFDPGIHFIGGGTNFCSTGEYVFFRMDLQPTSQRGALICKTDGTVAGTEIAVDNPKLNADIGGGNHAVDADIMRAFKNKLFFEIETEDGIWRQSTQLVYYDPCLDEVFNVTNYPHTAGGVWNNSLNYTNQVWADSVLFFGSRPGGISSDYIVSGYRVPLLPMPDPDELVLDESCAGAGANDGRIEVDFPTGCDMEFIYEWTDDPSITVPIRTGLAPGNYELTVRDTNYVYNSRVFNYVIGSGGGVAIEIDTLSRPNCSLANGELNAIPINGVGPWTFSINGSPLTPTLLGANFPNLSSGTNYNVTVVDDNGCTGSFPTINFTPLPAPTTSHTITTPDPYIAGGGEVTLNATGGVTPYLYSRNGVIWQSSNVMSNLANGTYTFQVDAGGCIVDEGPVTISTAPSPTVNAVVTEFAGCTGDFGEIVVLVNGGTPPYTYNLDDQFGPYDVTQSAPLFTNLPPFGFYDATVTDDNGCQGQFNNVDVFGSPGSLPGTWEWDGSASTDWFDPDNWVSGCGVPLCDDQVVIPFGAPRYPELGQWGPAQANYLLMDPGTSISFTDANSRLEICEELFTEGDILMPAIGTIAFTNPDESIIEISGGSHLWHDVEIHAADFTEVTDLGFEVGTTGSLNFMPGAGPIDLNGGGNITIRNTTPGGISGYGPDAYIIGYAFSLPGTNGLRRYLNPTGQYDFPVGTWSSGYQLARVRFTTPTSINHLTATFVDNDFAGQGSLTGAGCSGTFQDYLDNGYWRINADANPMTGTYALNLLNSNYTNAGAGDQSTIARKASGAAVGTFVANGDCVPTSTVANTIRNNMQGFSDFATAISPVPLSLEILSLEATPAESRIVLNWAHQLPEQALSLSLERAPDLLQEFETLTTASLKTPTSVFEDTEVEPDTRYYYRMRADFMDGNRRYSNVVSAMLGENARDQLLVYPNPATNSIQVAWNATEEAPRLLEVYDAVGKLVYTAEPASMQGILRIPVSSWARGMYSIKLVHYSGGVQTQNLVLQD